MHRSVFCFLFLLRLFPGAAQSTADELEKAYAPFISKKPLEMIIKMKVADSRDKSLTQHMEPAELLTDIFAGFGHADPEDELLARVNPAVCDLDIQYYNLFRSTSGNLFFKTSIKWELDKGDFLTEKAEGEISLDTLIGNISIPRFLKSEQKSVFVKRQNAKIVNAVKENILNKARKQSCSLYQVNAFGKFLIPEKQPDDTMLAEQAALNGIANASANLLGFTISSETTVRDFGDVTDIISRKFSGELKSYRVLNEYNYKTADGYFCTIVSFIIKSNK